MTMTIKKALVGAGRLIIDVQTAGLRTRLSGLLPLEDIHIHTDCGLVTEGHRRSLMTLSLTLATNAVNNLKLKAVMKPAASAASTLRLDFC